VKCERCRVWFRAQGFMLEGLGFRVYLGFRVQGSGFLDLDFGLEGLGFTV